MRYPINSGIAVKRRVLLFSFIVFCFLSLLHFWFVNVHSARSNDSLRSWNSYAVKLFPFGRQQEMFEFFGPIEETFRTALVATFVSDHARVKNEARILGSFGKRQCHLLLSLDEFSA